MKYKVKFRVTRENGTKAKYSINIEEGASFELGADTIGAEDNDAAPAAPFCVLAVKDAALHVSQGSDSGELRVNNKAGSDFAIRPGDVLQVSEYSIEFLDVPHVAPQASETQFVDISEILPGRNTQSSVSRLPIVSKPDHATQSGIHQTTGVGQLSIGEQSPVGDQSQYPEVNQPTNTNNDALGAIVQNNAEQQTATSVPAAAAAAAAVPAETNATAMAAVTTDPAISMNAARAQNGGALPDAFNLVPNPDEVRRAQAHAVESPLDADPPAADNAIYRKPERYAKRRERAAQQSSSAQNFETADPLKHIVVSLIVSSVTWGFAGSIIAKYTGGMNQSGMAYGAAGGAAGTMALALLFHFARGYLGISARFTQILRFLSLASICGVFWSFSFAFPPSVLVFSSVLYGAGVLWFFVARFHADFKGMMVGVGSAALLTAAGGYVWNHFSPPAEHREGQEVASRTEQDPGAVRAPADVSGQPIVAAPDAATAGQQVTQPVTTQPVPGQAEAVPAAAVQPVAQAPAATVPVIQPLQLQPVPQLKSLTPPETDTLAQTQPVLEIQPSKNGQPRRTIRRVTDVPDSFANEEFFTAIKTGNLSVVQDLVSKRTVDLDFTLDHGMTALMDAAARGQSRVVSFLLTRRVNINAQDPNGTTALMWAVLRGHTDIVQMLLRKRANVNIRREDGDRAIDIARHWNHPDIYRLLNGKTLKTPARAVASRRPPVKPKPKPKRKPRQDDDDDDE